MAKTTISVDTSTRNALADCAKALGDVSMDAALRALLFRWACYEAFGVLDADPAMLADYRAEAQQLAEVDVAVTE